MIDRFSRTRIYVKTYAIMYQTKDLNKHENKINYLNVSRNQYCYESMLNSLAKRIHFKRK